MNTTLAACTGGIAAILVMFYQTKKWDTTAIINGFLAGLVGITCPCYWVTGLGACVIGGVAGIIVILAMELLEYLRIDDPVGAFPVHGACGIWGTLSLGLFATGQFGVPTAAGVDTSTVVKGLLYGGGMAQLMSQAIGSASVVLATLAASAVLMYAVKATGTLRVSAEGEIEGLDLHEHGMVAYPEYVIHGDIGAGLSAAAKPVSQSVPFGVPTASPSAPRH